MNVVLLEPEIPANAGNIARLCAVTGCHLHLVRPLGFFLDDRRLKRAGLDYWGELKLTVHDSWVDFLLQKRDSNLFCIETGGSRLYTDVTFSPTDYLVFGSETKGLPPDVLNAYSQYHITLPMRGTRSLNVANTVAVVVYEAWRQLGHVIW